MEYFILDPWSDVRVIVILLVEMRNSFSEQSRQRSRFDYPVASLMTFTPSLSSLSDACTCADN